MQRSTSHTSIISRTVYYLLTGGKSFLQAALLAAMLGACIANPTPHPYGDASDSNFAGTDVSAAADAAGDTPAPPSDTAVSDTGLDEGPAFDVFIGDTTGEPDAADAGMDTGPGVSCGPNLACDPGEICVTTVPGVCGGPAPGPEGCDPGCAETDCGDGQPVCVCDGKSCDALPADCGDCSCLAAGMDSCDCTMSDGVPEVTCYAP